MTYGVILFYYDGKLEQYAEEIYKTLQRDLKGE